MVDHVRTPKAQGFCTQVSVSSFSGGFRWDDIKREWFDDAKSAVEYAVKNKINQVYQRFECSNSPEYDGGDYEWESSYELLYTFHDGKWYGVDWKGDRDKTPVEI